VNRSIWQGSNIREHLQQIKYARTEKLRADQIQGRPVIIRSRVSCLPVCHLGIKRLTLFLPAKFGTSEHISLRVEHKLTVLQNRMPRKMYEPKK